MPAYILKKKQVLEVLWGLLQFWEPSLKKEYQTANTKLGIGPWQGPLQISYPEAEASLASW